jgi:hypothetical protein
VNRQPRIVWIFVAYQLLILVVWISIRPPASNGALLGWASGVGFGLLVLYWFIRGIKAAWWLAVIGTVFAVIPDNVPTRYWSGVATALVSLILLLSPSMRRHFFHRNVPAES